MRYDPTQGEVSGDFVNAAERAVAAGIDVAVDLIDIAERGGTRCLDIAGDGGVTASAEISANVDIEVSWKKWSPTLL